MKLVVRNLGRIRDAEIDLRPLTMFVGPNNTNKSWTVYAAYHLLALISLDYFHKREPPLRWSQAGAFDAIVKATRGVQDSGQRFVQLVARHSILEPGPRSLTASAYDLRHVVRGANDDASVELQLTKDEVQAGHHETATIELSRGPDNVALRLVLPGDNSYQWGEPEWTVAQVEVAIQPLLRGILHKVVPIPVERTHPELLGGVGQISLSSIPEISALQLRQVKDYGRHPDLRARLHRVMGVIPVRGSTVEFDVPGGPRLPFGSVSSVARNMAALDTFLAGYAERDDVVVIDEPEMNAHPKAQLAIAELLAAMVNRGVRVLFTTQSPYLADHLSTLMAASRLPSAVQEEVATGFELATTEAFIDPEKVAAYLFDEEDGAVTVSDILDRGDGTIDLHTFSDQSDRLNALYGRVLDLKTYRKHG